MKYAILAALLFVGGITLAYVEKKDETFIPIVRVRSIEGLYITLVQPRMARRSYCQATVDGFIKALDGACASCAVESTDCATRLEGIDKALANGDRLPIYTVLAEGMRVSVVGPPHAVRAACEGMATHLVMNGWKMATCVTPSVPKT
jgi:hypothetical protein